MQDLIAMARRTVMSAEGEIGGCEACTPEAEIPFCWVLDAVSGRDGAATDYILVEPAKCPRCRGRILEETLVEWM